MAAAVAGMLAARLPARARRTARIDVVQAVATT
jgi:hypothetical protein